jgi:hypothetical protein
MKDVGDQGASAQAIERVVHDGGGELAERRDADPKTDDALARRPEGPPELAVVECDGGRIRTREPGHGPGVHRTAEGWRETKNAGWIRAARTVSREDPQPEPPAGFSDPEHVAKIAATAALSVAAPLPADPATVREREPCESTGLVPPDDGHPRRVRAVPSSIAGSKDLGKRRAREAKRRRFAAAPAAAVLGDGLPWDGSIWERHFADFAPILDSIPVLSYLYLAAPAVPEAPGDGWDQYRAWRRGAWGGEVEPVREERGAWRAERGESPEGAPESDPRTIRQTTMTDPGNNRDRMKYPECRRAGLPVTTAWIESLVEEMKDRVKGTARSWSDPPGAEAILQVRAAALCDDERLTRHLRTRPGCPFPRRPRSPEITAEKIRS